MTQEQTQYKNQGQETRAQKHARNQEKKAAKQAEKQAKTQSGTMTRTKGGVEAQEKVATQNKGASSQIKVKNAAKVSTGTPGGKK
jgi:hypothetical protein